jgi:peptidoglycan/LPS O-acetylase OafA/YrhL
VTARSGHLHEIDLLRLLTFASVIAVHSLSFADPTPLVPWFGLETLLHFTRQVFFGLTGFVLVYGYLRRPRPMSVFWPKRFLLVGVPYLTWSLVYVFAGWIASDTRRGDVPSLVTSFATDVLTGNAKYHLYFLLVTMEVYLIVPGLVWLAHRAFRMQMIVLTAAFVVQMAILAVFKYSPDTYGPLYGWVENLFPTYLFPIVGGAVAAAHGDAFLGWIRRRRGTVGLIVAAGAVVTLGVYAIQLALGQSPASAATEMQPVEAVWSAVAGVGLLTVGAIWADRRRAASRTSRFIEWASDRSFGVYLAHPLVIWLVLLGPAFDALVPHALRFPALYLCAAVGAMIISDAFRRTPASMPFTGRPFTRAVRPPRRPAGRSMLGP